jgi:hypothetical protein
LAQTLQNLFTHEADQLARQTQAIRRTRQFTGATLAQTLVFGWLDNPQATLDDLAFTAATCQAPVSAQAVDRHFTPATADFLQHLLTRAMDHAIRATPAAIPLLQRFTDLELRDSTTLALPDALADVWPGCGGRGKTSRAALKVHLCWNFRDARLRLAWVPGRQPDQAAASQKDIPRRGTLRLADMGFFDLDEFRCWDAHGVFWLSRLPVGVQVAEAKGTLRSLPRWLRRHKSPTIDTWVYLGGLRVPARLLAQRVPRGVARQRRDKIRREAREAGTTPNPLKLALAGWTLLVTNVPAARLSVKEALVVGRVRWQAELLIKLWKEHGRLDESRSAKPWRIACEVFAKLLGLVIQHWTLLLSQWEYVDRSLRKAAPKVRKFMLALAQALSSLKQMRSILRRLIHGLKKCSRINKSKKTPRTHQILMAATSPDG